MKFGFIDFKSSRNFFPSLKYVLNPTFNQILKSFIEPRNAKMPTTIEINSKVLNEDEDINKSKKEKINNPQKKRVRNKEIEDKARRRLLETLPDELKDIYRPYILDMENDPLWPLAKAADTLSAYLKCAEEIQAGNSEFEEAFRTTENKLKNLHLKEVDWFLEHFAGSFALTLDEMKRM